MFKNKQIDFLAIGDIATDAFIKIINAEAKCDLHGDNCKLCLNFGAKIPYESVDICDAVGNAPNVAVSVSRLGIKPYLVSYLGNDETGNDSINELKKSGINTKYLKIIKNAISNYHYVLWFGTERTILVKHTEFPYSLPTNLPESKWVYLSSLASNSINYHDEINKYLVKYPNAKLVFQPGTFQIKQGVKHLSNLYEKSYLLLCNHEEAETILETKNDDIPILLKAMHNLGPKIVVITDGIKGSYVYNGKDIWFIESYPQKAFESTGAGDAYSSAFTVALIYGKNIEEALIWGSINAMSVVGQVGPQKGLMSRKDLEEYIKNISKNYKPKKIN